jgi:hypothetical protein
VEDGASPVRTFYIPPHARFTVANVSAGKYDVRYRDLESGELSRSETFSIDELRLLDSVRFSDFTLTLLKVRSGNTTTGGLRQSEF